MNRLRHRLNKHPVKQEEGPNPKTLRLEKLVSMIDRKILSYYLQQVSMFLKNPKKDLWFPQISANLDAFLVRMIRDEQNLESLLDVFDGKSRRFAEEILANLKENEDVFKLAHSYDSSKSNKNTLVYKKVFSNKSDDSAVTNQFHRMCPQKSKTKFEDVIVLSPPGAAPQKPPDEDPVPGFKLQWFKAILRFIRDDDMDHMEFPEMSIKEAELIASCMAYPKITTAAMRPMYDALREAKQTYDFKVSFLHLCKDRVRLLVKKVTLNNNKEEDNRVQIPDASKAQKSLQKKKQLVQNLEPVFTKTALQMILDFINNETEASIVFKNANEDQSSFLQSACSMARTKKMHGAFDADSQELLKKIAKLLGDGQKFDLKIDVTKLEKETKLRTVTIIKQPRWDSSDELEEEPHTSTANPPLRVSSRSGSSLEHKNQMASTSSYTEPQTSTKSPSSDNIRPIDKTTQNSTIAKPVATIAKPVATVAKPVATIAKPVATIEKPVAAIAKPVATMDKPVATIAKPVATTSKPVATTAKPVATTAKPVATTAKPVATTAKPIDYKAKTIDNLIANVKSIGNAIAIDNAKVATSTQVANNPPNNCANRVETVESITQTIETGIDYSLAFPMDRNKVISSVNTKAAIYTKSIDATVIENTKAIDNVKKITNPTPIDYVKAIDQARTITKTQPPPKNVKLDAKDRQMIKHYSKFSGSGPTSEKVKELCSNMAIDTGKDSTDKKEQAAGIDKHVEPRVPMELSDGRPLPARKVKLIEAMSVPMESDKAMRMMRQMGWEGGPLGTRGEGITEPIMPALNIAAGAGLGHIKPKKEAPKAKNFRLEILNHILCLIREEPLKKTVLYPNQISKKERGFLLNAVTAFSNRSPLQMCDDQLRRVVRAVSEELSREPALQLHAVLHEDKRSITLSKNDVQKHARPAPPPRAPQGPPPETVLAVLGRYARSNHVSIDGATNVGNELGAQSVKAAKGLGHRVVILAKILELIKGNKYELTLTFEYSLTLKQSHFIKETMAAFNLRGRPSYGVYENYLVNEILELVGDVHLTPEFGSTHRSLTLKKKPNQRCRNHTTTKDLAEIFNNNNNNNKPETSNNNNNKPETSNNNKDVANIKIEISNDNIEVANNSKLKIELPTQKALDKVEPDKGIVNVDLPTHKAFKIVEDEGIEAECDNKVSEITVVSSDSDSTDSEDENDIVAKDLVDKVEVSYSEELVDVQVVVDVADDCREKDGEVIKPDDDSIKQCKSDAEESINNRKKTTLLPKYLCIAPDSYPIEEVDFDIITAFQNSVCDKIEKDDAKTLIECVGLKNGAIIYGCHNENGIVLIESVAREMDLKTTNITNLYKGKKRFKVNARINSYLDVNLKKLFDRLEEYNEGLKTDLWTVTDVKKNKDNIEMVIEVDGNSFDYISQNGFGLFAGMDKIKFCVVWN